MNRYVISAAIVVAVSASAQCGAGEVTTSKIRRAESALTKRFNDLLDDPKVFAQTVEKECHMFPEGDMAPFVFAAYGYTSLAVDGKIKKEEAAKRIAQAVIGQDGFPVRMVVPDPRAFAIHKLWLSEQEDREPGKKARDRKQALSAARVVRQYLPQYRFVSSELKMFPKDLVARLLKEFPSSPPLDMIR